MTTGSESILISVFKQAAVGVLICCLVLSAGCQSTGSNRLLIWAAGDWEQVLPYSVAKLEDPLIFSRGSNVVTLVGARNEVVSFQLVLTAGQMPVDGVSLALEQFVPPPAQQASIIPADNIRLYQVGYVSLDGFSAGLVRSTWPPPIAGRFPDILIPLDGNTNARLLNIPAGTNQPVWIDLSIPDNASAGRYSSRIHVQINGRNAYTVKLELTVLDIDLPQDNPIDLIAILDVPQLLQTELGSTHRGPLVLSDLVDQADIDKTAEMIKKYVTLADQCGVQLWPGGMYPRIKLQVDGSLRVWWQRYKQLQQAFVQTQSTSYGKKYWPVPVDYNYPEPRKYGGIDSPLYGQVIDQYLESIGRELSQEPLDNCYFMLPGLRAGPLRLFDRQMMDKFAALAGSIRKSKQPVTIINRFVPQSLKPYGARQSVPQALEQLTDIYCPPQQWWDPGTMVKLQEAGKAVWWQGTGSVGATSGSLVRGNLVPRSWAWTAFRYGTSAVVIPQFNDFPIEAYYGTVNEQSSSSGRWWVYPGPGLDLDGPAGSIRLKMLRRGLQDLKYLMLLERADQCQFAQWISRQLVRHAHLDSLDGSLLDVRNDGLVDDGRAWELARRVMADQLIKAAASRRTVSPGGDNDTLSQRITGRQFVDLTSKILLEVESVRALDDPADKDPAAVQWEFSLVVRNYTDKPVSGILKFASIGENWQVLVDKVRIGPLPWAVPVRTTLKLRSARLWTSAEGLFYQGIVFEPDDKTVEPIEVLARTTAMVSQFVENPIAIDGKLDDWPAGLTNTAGQFLLIGPDQHQVPANQRRASQQSQVSIAHDARNLYFAFVCYEARPDRIYVKPTNTVNFDGLLGWGEDLVEILIDPQHSKSTNPGDLYHLIIKANGTVISYRGIPATPPLMTSRPWASSATAAVGIDDDRWIVEVSIPLEQLDRQGQVDRWWGLNMARHESRLCESSSWSGAKRHFCSPMSLGNLLIGKAVGSGTGGEE